jgi:hypothetical protein
MTGKGNQRSTATRLLLGLDLDGDCVEGVVKEEKKRGSAQGRSILQVGKSVNTKMGLGLTKPEPKGWHSVKFP